jgi:hypothetical protein
MMKYFPWTGRRVVWTVGMALGGLLLGGKTANSNGIVIGLIWGASVGYGFGIIFDREQTTKHLVAYWAATLALTGVFFGLLVDAGMHPSPTDAQQTVAGAIGAVSGATLGLLIGTLQVRRLRRRSAGF